MGQQISRLATNFLSQKKTTNSNQLQHYPCVSSSSYLNVYHKKNIVWGFLVTIIPFLFKSRYSSQSLNLFDCSCFIFIMIRTACQHLSGWSHLIVLRFQHYNQPQKKQHFGQNGDHNCFLKLTDFERLALLACVSRKRI